ncbi:MAG: sigma-70 family RNA polymerase sigma factor [Saprospiraceae bacterium]|nr:sigma-70 family RNA polymerase sigma factor [Saprospiraceae bacterium]
MKPFSDISDFEAIFKEYFNPLVNFIYKFVKNYETSEEIVQNTFAKIWSSRDKIEVTTSTKAYLYQMSKNAMIDYIRKYHGKECVQIEHEQLENLQDSTEEYLDPYIVRQVVETQLKVLKDKPREIFILNKFEGLTYEEIADYLKISKRSVEDNISKVTKILKEKLKAHPELFN